MSAPAASLYTPPDVELAWRKWRANCGPAAIAALMGQRLGVIMPELLQLRWPGYTTFSFYRAYLELKHFRTGPVARRDVTPTGRARVWAPRHGIATMQIDGPWCNPGLPVGAALTHTHVIAVHREPRLGTWVYDVNANDCNGGWLPFTRWEQEIAARIVASHAGAVGWYLRYGLEVGTTHDVTPDKT